FPPGWVSPCSTDFTNCKLLAEDGRSRIEDSDLRSSILAHPPALDLYFREYPEWVGLEYLQFILGRQKLQAIDHGNQIIRRFSRLGAHRAARSWRFRAEKRLIDAALLDGGSQKVNVVRAGVVKQILAQIFLRDVVVRWNKPI